MATYGTGSLLSLDAVGKQDTYLTSNTSCDSAFNYQNVRHSNFSVTNRVYTVSNPGDGSPNWPFDKEIIVTMKPQGMGDLLSNMYFKCDLPEIPGNNFTKATYTDQIGRALIDTITFRVDGVVVETLENDWGIIHDEIFLTSEEKSANKFKVNGGSDYGLLPADYTVDASTNRTGPAVGPVSVYVSLNFFFSRSYASSDTNNTLMLDSFFKPYFPVCAISNQEIQIVIKFNPVTFFTKLQDDGSTISLDKFELVNEEIILSDEERHFLQHHKQELMTEVVKRNAIMPFDFTDTASVKCYLVPTIPVKAMFWFFRDVRYDNKDTDNNFDNYLQRYNYSGSPVNDYVVDNEKLYPIMSDAKIFINSIPMLGFIESDAQDNIHTSNYYKYMQPMQHELSSPIRNIYTYSFALKPKESTPTGVLNFSTVDSTKSFINASLLLNSDINPDRNRQFNMHVYFLGYQMLVFENGFMSLKYATF
jgi:hypothetical protein